MLDEMFARPHRRHIKDLNIVPILDMLTTVIFFLLLSTGFMEYTKLTLPPSATSVVTSTQDKAPPLSPKLLMAEVGGSLRMVLTWAGEKAGERDEKIDAATLKDPRARRKELMARSAKLVEQFAKDYPAEKTLQLGIGGKLPYQDLISIMDGAREKMPDVVLISGFEADARVNKTAPDAAAAAGGK